MDGTLVLLGIVIGVWAWLCLGRATTVARMSYPAFADEPVPDAVEVAVSAIGRGVSGVNECPLCAAPVASWEWDDHLFMCIGIEVGLELGPVVGGVAVQMGPAGVPVEPSAQARAQGRDSHRWGYPD